MRATRRLSQAISEGDGISVLVPVRDADAARAAESQGAEGIVLTAHVPGVRDATTLPIVWGLDGSPDVARSGDADAYVVVVERLAPDPDALTEIVDAVQRVGLECVLDVRDEEELAVALERVDPEILLLSSRDADDEGPLERVLDLLPDVPAGKLAIADVAAGTRDDVLALERAGVDAVIARPGDVAELVGRAPLGV